MTRTAYRMMIAERARANLRAGRGDLIGPDGEFDQEIYDEQCRPFYSVYGIRNLITGGVQYTGADSIQEALEMASIYWPYTPIDVVYFARNERYVSRA
jgi:hypothetical protein